MELLARDGATMADVSSQVRRLPKAATCAVLSIGGNDAIRHIDLLERSADSAAEVLEELGAIAEQFEARYRELVRAVSRQVRRLVLCTIYEPPMFDPRTARLVRVPLGLLNDRIIRTGTSLGLDVLDLRSVCTRPSDYVRAIEPSAVGAAKIARAVADLLLGRPRRGAGLCRLAPASKAYPPQESVWI